MFYGLNMKRRTGTSSRDTATHQRGLWFKGLMVCSIALMGHLTVRYLIGKVRDSGLAIFAQPEPGGLSITVRPSASYTEQVLTGLYHQILIGSYYVTAGVLGLGLIVLTCGIAAVLGRR